MWHWISLERELYTNCTLISRFSDVTFRLQLISDLVLRLLIGTDFYFFNLISFLQSWLFGCYFGFAKHVFDWYLSITTIQGINFTELFHPNSNRIFANCFYVFSLIFLTDNSAALQFSMLHIYSHLLRSRSNLLWSWFVI